ncbi:MAG: sigma-70 family RNA polymerase sigma factor [Ignavibacteriota bacterium]|jgi:RNA polymerase sigma-70 factor (ECF subfamily)|nr:MAG: sigma-70 family RNA polymerase sigma factor [Chlorobiota bacterium]MBE7477196.1 sigma-70 family RNA polymerase sigma factor [Ignavibacteriales bacterium]MBL1122580.1 sigma-70 family RNA polymerase sigma factor [Ignavibacteriota bacterium]MBV6419040.1 ECF RNA polymerase sigma-E factor [Ignavibacteriaceae bacterium]MCE7856717.1 sigma-70 family RNA polymerase sigma factor [Ignavibacteria bacterium CHB3]MEB2296069.1 sigma-70 family RNA polymerase sigma factor [Ignavibacteria bacterium]
MILKEEEKDLQQQQKVSFNDDHSIIRKFLDGDNTAFQILVSRHKEKVRNIIYLTMNNSALVDDIAQDVFITVYRNLKHFRFESQFTTWLYRITVNRCKDYLRKMNVRKIFFPVEDGIEISDYSSPVESNDISKIVMDAISRLPNKLKMPLIMKDIEGFSYQEISETLNCEMGTVKSRIFRGREKLKEILQPIEKELR